MLKEKDNLPFRENLRKHTLDISVGSLMFLVFSFMIYERVSGVLPVSGKTNQKQKVFQKLNDQIQCCLMIL